MRLTPPLQKAVFAGKLTDRENIQNWVLNQPEVLPRLNARLLTEPSAYLQLNDIRPCGDAYIVIGDESKLNASRRAQCLLESLKYLAKSDDQESGSPTRWLSVWLVGDMNVARGRELLVNGLRALKKSNNLRISVIHNGDALKAIATTTTNDGLKSALNIPKCVSSLNSFCFA